MYAIVKTGGKQVRVAQGETIQVERLEGEVGGTVTFDQVLLLAEGDKVTVGTPFIEKATVTATITEQKRDKKIIVFKKKRRQNYRRKKGHRQYLTLLTIDGLSLDGKAPAKKAAAPKAKKETKTTAKKAPAKKKA